MALGFGKLVSVLLLFYDPQILEWDNSSSVDIRSLIGTRKKNGNSSEIYVLLVDLINLPQVLCLVNDIHKLQEILIFLIFRKHPTCHDFSFPFMFHFWLGCIFVWLHDERKWFFTFLKFVES